MEPMRPQAEAALAAVEGALRLAASRVGADRITSKGGRDLATDTDVAAEDLIRTELASRYPDYVVVGEERGGEPGDRPYWLVDPICGTRNFASELPVYAINVALVEDGEVTLSVVGNGANADRYVAERGRGSWLFGPGGRRALRASDASDTISLDVGYAAGGPHRLRAAEFTRAAILANRWYLRILGSSIAFAYVAAGQVSAHLLFKSDPVHTAAGCLLASEAGAIVTDLEGRPWDLATRAFLLAATPELHRDLLGLAATSVP